MKWHQNCPRCGFAASRLDRTCQRCGADLTEAGASSETACSKDPSKKEASIADGGTSQVKPSSASSMRRWLPAALAAALVILLAEAAGLYMIWTSGLRTSASPVGGTDPGAVTDGIRHATGVTQHGGSSSVSLPDASGIGELFQARPSPRAKPTIEMYNRTDGTRIHVDFIGPREYSGIIRPGAKLKFQLPKGSYSVRLWAPGVEPRSGRAVFKQHTHYTTQWHIVSGLPGPGPPLRMGDLAD